MISPDHIGHFYFLPVMGTIQMLFSFIFVVSLVAFPKEPFFVYYFEVCWKNPITLVIVLAFIQ